ncbi:hypothetical protein CJ030_MR3G005773 [Morella rubra]|uniref:F-box domain-containing protein n=1 Tax=Morella rubra TaxID=262757 RepID=A0A6A1W3F5_9ROSI|nr:hypothetical protein CJ030_MR3G005773 [Morella rubra]
MGTESEAVDLFDELPEGCIANVLSFTTPRDACRSSSVSTTFRSAAESDSVWDRFLPPECWSLMSRSVDSSSLRFSSKKELYLLLCDRPLLIDGGKKSFSLERESGRKCYMLSSKDLVIIWVGTPRYWKWTSLPESRFPEVPELIGVCWLEIRGKINTSMLSPGTRYTACLVFKVTAASYGFEYQPVEVAVGLVGGMSHKRTVYLDAERVRIMELQAPEPSENEDAQYPTERGDGWFEIELGEFFTGGEDGELEMSVLEIKGGNWKSGLIVEGIEIRPKEGK